jgi:hypothetical protein
MDVELPESEYMGGVMGGSAVASWLKGDTFYALVEASLISSLLVVVYLVWYKGESQLPDWLQKWAMISVGVYVANEIAIWKTGKNLQQMYMQRV